MEICKTNNNMISSIPLRKKGGINIKKIKFFLMLFATIFITKYLTINVNAATIKFYEAEYIDGIYMNKYQYSSKTKYYQTARFFRKRGTDEFAYCVEPFNFFGALAQYEETQSPYNLTREQVDKISKIAHFGYGYGSHTEAKWYAITQFMIWQVANPTEDYYFSTTLNGERADLFQSEINEINQLVANYSTIPSISNQNYTIVEGKNLIITDTTNTLNNYLVNNENAKISGNQLIIENLKEGNYEFILSREEKVFNKPYIFYQSNDSQNLVTTGDLAPIQSKINISVIKTKIEITKIDKDTQSITPSGSASLDGAIFKLYNQQNKEIAELKIEKNQATIYNIDFGTYYLKEVTSGNGYTTSEKTYKIDVTKDNYNIEQIIENEVIKKKITIQKKYGETNNLLSEKNIQFKILNEHNEYLETITTNEEGFAEITLPYGLYTFIQMNSTEGYEKVDSFIVEVKNTENEIIELKDLKIPVPNTHTEKTNNSLLWIIKIFLILF